MTRQLIHLSLYGLLTVLLALPAHALDSYSTATYSELNKPLFIAELFLDAGVTPNSLLDTPQAFEIHLTVLAKSIGSRQFRRIWLEGVAINNEPSTLAKLNASLSDFNNLFKGRLQYGDDFRVRFTERGQSLITLNGITLMSQRHNNFAPVLLSSWLGQVPLSAQMKKQLIGGHIEAKSHAIKSQLSFSKQRQREIEHWLEPAPSIAVAEQPKVVAAVATNTESRNSTLFDDAGINPSQLAHLPPAHSGGQKMAHPPFAENEDIFSMRQSYYAQLNQHLQSFQNHDSAAAFKKPIRLWIEIDRQGEIVGQNILHGSEDDFQRHQALAILKRAAPFPAIPSALPDHSVSFSASLSVIPQP